MGTVNCVRREKYGGTKELLEGMVQGNIFTAVACRDASCVAFKKFKKKETRD